jgi:hypothetical protein
LGTRRILAWAATVSGSWALAWIITKAVIIDEQKGFVTFGLSGALLATIATGVVLRIFLGRRAKKSDRAASTDAPAESVTA